MGKSDPFVQEQYRLSLLNLFNRAKKVKIDSVAFFGFSRENALTSALSCPDRYFYDLSLGNWNINTFPYETEKEVDLIVCTRCAYFSKDPKKMMQSFYEILKEGGMILIDWGLGDHWRFDNYKVGWIKEGEHEWCYEKDNFLWSALSIEEEDLESNEVYNFCNSIKRKGYNSVQKAILNEVPSIISKSEISDIGFLEIKVDFKFLWPDQPQLYSIVTAIK